MSELEKRFDAWRDEELVPTIRDKAIFVDDLIKLCRAAWMNGAYVQEYITEEV